MAGYKGIGIMFLRQHVRAAGDDLEARLLPALSDADRAAYASTGATEWVPVELAVRLFTVAAPMVYPAEGAPLRRMGREMAKHNLAGVYRYIVRVLTVPFLIEQAATLWRTYHARGEARVIRTGERVATLEVTGYPDLPELIREMTSGWMAQAVEMTGATGARVAKSDDDLRRWTWVVHWT